MTVEPPAPPPAPAPPEEPVRPRRAWGGLLRHHDFRQLFTANAISQVGTQLSGLALPVLVFSVLLFYGGALFAYFLVFPLVFGFLVGAAPEGVTVMTDMSRYLDFALALFFAFGLAFQVPIVAIVLVWVGVTTPQAMTAKRSYVIVGAFVVGAVLTPPDVFSQTLLAVPMWLLFELGVLVGRLVYRPAPEDDGEEPPFDDNKGDNQGGGGQATN